MYFILLSISFLRSFETVFKSSTTSHKVSKLHEQTQYSFRIRAANEAGYGPYSEILVCQTAIQPPAVIKGLCHDCFSLIAFLSIEDVRGGLEYLQLEFSPSIMAAKCS